MSISELHLVAGQSGSCPAMEMGDFGVSVDVMPGWRTARTIQVE
jgi:hypothetical protein